MLVMIPKKIHVLTKDLESIDAKIPLTRTLVSLDPHEDKTEYTDLSQVWHDDEKERPENGKFIVWWSFNENGITKWKWADIEDLLPKGNEKCVTKCYKTNTNSKDEKDI